MKCSEHFNPHRIPLGEGVTCDLGRADTREVVLTRDPWAALARLNPLLPPAAITEAVQEITRHDFTRSLLQHNQAFYKFIRDGAPVSYKDAFRTLNALFLAGTLLLPACAPDQAKSVFKAPDRSLVLALAVLGEDAAGLPLTVPGRIGILTRDGDKWNH